MEIKVTKCSRSTKDKAIEEVSSHSSSQSSYYSPRTQQTIFTLLFEYYNTKNIITSIDYTKNQTKT